MSNISAMKHNPAAFFKAPKEVARATDLNKEEKIEILKHWAYDEREKLVAEEENMPGNPDASDSKLSDILKALLELGESDVNHSPPTKQA